MAAFLGCAARRRRGSSPPARSVCGERRRRSAARSDRAGPGAAPAHIGRRSGRRAAWQSGWTGCRRPSRPSKAVCEPRPEAAEIGIVIEGRIAAHQQAGEIERRRIGRRRRAATAPWRRERSMLRQSAKRRDVRSFRPPSVSGSSNSQIRAAAPTTIRYQPKGAKPRRETMPMNQRITSSATRKETTKPIAMPPEGWPRRDGRDASQARASRRRAWSGWRGRS